MTIVIDDGYIPSGVTFDGVNDYLLRGADYTGNSDSATGILSFWFRIEGTGDQTWQLMSGTGGSPSVTRFFSGFATPYGISIDLRNAAATSIFQFRTATGFQSSATWHHFLASWNTNAAAGARTSHLYIDDVSDKVINADSGAAFNVDYTVSNHSIGANTIGTEKYNGDLADFYFAPGQFFDFSVEANRRLFIDDAGNPVDLGATGTFPTGSAPILLLSGEVSTWPTNKGTGNGMTLTGTLTPSLTNPGE